MSNVRRTQIAKIKIAQKDLGMDEDTYRDMLQLTTGKRSASELDFHQRNAVLHHLETKLGWKPKPKKVGPKSHESRPGKKKSQGDKIRALWIEMANQKIIKSSSEESLRSYIKRMTHDKYEAPQFCDTFTAQRIIESLKQWQQRELDKRDLNRV